MNLKRFKELLQKNNIRWEQYRFPLLVLLFGIMLMLLPQKLEKQDTDTIASDGVQQEDTIEERLTALLESIDGAGRVCVMLTLETGSVTTFQQDTDRITATDREELHQETVLLDKDQPLVSKMTYPIYRGAVVICQGADRPSVKLNVIRAVSSLTGLGSDKITVIKMKG